MQARETKILSIYTGELQKYKRQPMYEAIVYAAKKAGIDGATVLKGIMSFGPGSQVHSTKLFALSSDLPIKIEIIEEQEKLKAFAEIAKKMFEKSKSTGLIAMQDFDLIYRISHK